MNCLTLLGLVSGREYIQPQWVLDCFNESRLLPVGDYGIGKTPPPHLSPFVDDASEGYVPKRREELDALKTDSSTAAVDVEMDEEEGVDGKKEELVFAEETAEAKFIKEVTAESKGVWASEFKEEEVLEEDVTKKFSENDENSSSAEDSSEEDSEHEEEDAEKKEAKKTKKQVEEEEHLERRKAMMPKKNKRLYQRIEKGEKQKADLAKKLGDKAKKVTEKKILVRSEGLKKKKVSSAAKKSV